MEVIQSNIIIMLYVYNHLSSNNFPTVSSYLNQNKRSSEHIRSQSEDRDSQVNNQSRTIPSSAVRHMLPATQPNYSSHFQDHFDVGKILTSGSVFVRQWGTHTQTSLDIPEGFWDNREAALSLRVIQQIEYDLDW